MDTSPGELYLSMDLFGVKSHLDRPLPIDRRRFSFRESAGRGVVPLVKRKARRHGKPYDRPEVDGNVASLGTLPAAREDASVLSFRDPWTGQHLPQTDTVSTPSQVYVESSTSHNGRPKVAVRFRSTPSIITPTAARQRTGNPENAATTSPDGVQQTNFSIPSTEPAALPSRRPTPWTFDESVSIEIDPPPARRDIDISNILQEPSHEGSLGVACTAVASPLGVENNVSGQSGRSGIPSMFSDVDVGSVCRSIMLLLQKHTESSRPQLRPEVIKKLEDSLTALLTHTPDLAQPLAGSVHTVPSNPDESSVSRAHNNSSSHNSNRTAAASGRSNGINIIGRDVPRSQLVSHQTPNSTCNIKTNIILRPAHTTGSSAESGAIPVFESVSAEKGPGRCVRPFQSATGSGDTVWYQTVSNSTLSSPSTQVIPEVADLYIHKDSASNTLQIWICRRAGSWDAVPMIFNESYLPDRVVKGLLHPLFPDRVLKVRINGEPSWVTKQSCSTIKSRRKP